MVYVQLTIALRECDKSMAEHVADYRRQRTGWYFISGIMGKALTSGIFRMYMKNRSPDGKYTEVQISFVKNDFYKMNLS